MIKEITVSNDDLLIFGGPYSNLHALQALRKVAEEKSIKPTQIICTGDIVGYCAFPDESVKFVRDWGIHTIAGNVEFNLRDEADDCGCNFDEGSRCDLLSRQWYPFAKSKISQEALTYLHNIPEFIRFEYHGKKYFVLHGSYENTSEFIFKSTNKEVKEKTLNVTNADVILAGHCGIPFSDDIENKRWLNAGVIGMPANDGKSNTWYCILSNGVPTFHQLQYDHHKANQAMLENPLPKSYAKTLVDGIWDNCDVLPEIESAMQGKELSFP